MSDFMNVFGVKQDGSTVLLGESQITPAMKRVDIARNWFGAVSLDQSGTDADYCLWALADYHEWLVDQGWTGPAIEFKE